MAKDGRFVAAIQSGHQSGTGLRDGSIDFYVGLEPGRPVPSELLQEVLFENTRIVLGRRGHRLARATSLAELADAEWVTTSITQNADEEMGALFRGHGLPAPRLAVQSQSALTLIVTLLSSDLLAMAPVQWIGFAPTAGSLQAVPVREALPAPRIVLVRRAGLPLTLAVPLLADLLRRAALVPAGAGGCPPRAPRPLRRAG